MPLDKLKRQIEVIANFDIRIEIPSILLENREYCISLLKSQLSLGRDADDNPITVYGRDYYSDTTVWIKERYGIGIGKFTEWITLYFTGTFYDSIRFNVEGEDFWFDSELSYYDKIKSMSGNRTMDLTKENLILIGKEIVVPQLRKRFKERFDAA